LGSEGAIRLSQQSRDSIVIAVGDSEISDSVAIEIAAGSRRGHAAHRKVGPAKDVGLSMGCEVY
jgi:hypothetical protein